jgi:hypothetical protein
MAGETVEYSAKRLIFAPLVLLGGIFIAAGWWISQLPGTAHIRRLFNMEVSNQHFGWLLLGLGAFLTVFSIVQVISPLRVIVDGRGVRVTSPFHKAEYLWDEITGFEEANWSNIAVVLTPAARRRKGNFGNNPQIPKPSDFDERRLFAQMRAAKGTRTDF